MTSALTGARPAAAGRRPIVLLAFLLPAILAACSDSPFAPAFGDPTTAESAVKDKRTQPTTTTPTTTTPTVPTTTTAAPAPTVNVLAGARLYVDPRSNAQAQVNAWASTRPLDADQIRKIASQPQAFWFNEWTGPIESTVDTRTTEITNAGAVPVYVAYNIPVRDCGSYSGGGATSADAYRSWIRGFSAGLRGRKAVVLLEPDALAGMGCLSAAMQQERLSLLSEAVSVLKAGGPVAVYLDGGHSAWMSATTMANRLIAAGIAKADGFALNVSNFQTTSASTFYGETISGLTGGRHFVIDVSRNGSGASSGGEWCNPSGRSLGSSPTTNTGNALIDALLWVKRPGESDGACNGGPTAGKWFADWALTTASSTAFLLAYAG